MSRANYANITPVNNSLSLCSTQDFLFFYSCKIEIILYYQLVCIKIPLSSTSSSFLLNSIHKISTSPRHWKP